ELETRPSRRVVSLFLFREGPFVEGPLRFPVGIQRLQLRSEGFVIIVTEFARAVGRRRGSVNERDLLARAPIPDHLRVPKIHLREVGLVELGRIGACSEMNDRGNRRMPDVLRLCLQPFTEFLPIDDRSEVDLPGAFQVFSSVAKIRWRIDGNDGDTPVVTALDESSADESG